MTTAHRSEEELNQPVESVTTPEQMTPERLRELSVGFLKRGQADTGAYVASPSFSQYGFAWLRDGSFCAMAMDAASERSSSERFHAWVARALLARSERIADIARRRKQGHSTIPRSLMLPTRYHLDGTEEPPGSEWPNLQWDGYGMWLVALREHLGGDAPGYYDGPIRLAADYITAIWDLPCFDYWEESGHRIHTSTLAALAGGLRAAGDMLDEPGYAAAADTIRAYILDNCVRDGRFVKGPEDDRVDASLLSLRMPLNLVARDDERWCATRSAILRELCTDSGGVRRYSGDVYYGGSPWILLTAWLGWESQDAGDIGTLRRLRDWVVGHAGADGSLPEQATDEATSPEALAHWEQLWGPVADPLLWSHAMFLLQEEAAGATPAPGRTLEWDNNTQEA